MIAADRVSTQRRGRWLVTATLVGLSLALVGAVVAVSLHPTGGDAATAPSPTATAQAPATPAPTAGTPSGSLSPSQRPSAPIRLVGFGDSVMYGAGCDCDDFLSQTSSLVQQRTARPVDTVNNAANGETAAELLNDLRTDDAYTTEIARADVIVLTIGANDLSPVLADWVSDACDVSCYRPEVEAMGDRLSAILTIIDRHKQAGARVLVLTYWNVFEDGDVGAADHDDGYLAWSDAVTRNANAAICQAATLAAATCVDLYEPFKGVDGRTDPTGLLADDGDHPNAAGTALIADVVATTVLRAASR